MAHRNAHLKNGKYLAGVIIIALVTTLLPLGAFAASNSDIKGHWAEGIIEEWLARDLAGGYPDGTFRPNNPVSRAEFVVFLNRAFGVRGAGEGAVFTDIPETAWFYKDISAAWQAGIVSGYPDGSFRPQNLISRQEAAAILGKFIKVVAVQSTNFVDN